MWHGPRVLLIRPEPWVPESKDASELPQLPSSARLSPRPEFMSFRFPHPPDEEEGSVAARATCPDSAPDAGVLLLPPTGGGLGFAGCPGGADRFLALVAASSPEPRAGSSRSSAGGSPWATKLPSSSQGLARFAVSASSFPVAGDEAAAIAAALGVVRAPAPTTIPRLAANPALFPPEQPEPPDAHAHPHAASSSPAAAVAAEAVKPYAPPPGSLAKLALPAALFPPDPAALRATESRTALALARLALPPARFPPAAEPAPAVPAPTQHAQAAQPALASKFALGAPSAPAKRGAVEPRRAAALGRFAVAPARLPPGPPEPAQAQAQPAARDQPAARAQSASATTTTSGGESALRRLSAKPDLFPPDSAGARAGGALLRLGVSPHALPPEQPDGALSAAMPAFSMPPDEYPPHLDGEAAAVAGSLRKFRTNVRRMPRTASTGSAELDAVGATRDENGMVWFQE